ncbi:MAG TPA: hypothetical protein VHH88_13345 [Verrucomicrobiae bacterium]|nr:hypothetical protein [Verrucomicrobiae bacterium]
MIRLIAIAALTGLIAVGCARNKENAQGGAYDNNSGYSSGSSQNMKDNSSGTWNSGSTSGSQSQSENSNSSTNSASGQQ